METMDLEETNQLLAGILGKQRLNVLPLTNPTHEWRKKLPEITTFCRPGELLVLYLRWMTVLVPSKPLRAW